MEKGRPKRLLGLIKKKQQTNQASKSPSPSADRNPAGKPASGPKTVSKGTGASSTPTPTTTTSIPVGGPVDGQTSKETPGVQQKTTAVDKAAASTSPSQFQTYGRSGSGASPKQTTEASPEKTQSSAQAALLEPEKDEPSGDASKTALSPPSDAARPESKDSTQAREAPMPSTKEASSSGSSGDTAQPKAATATPAKSEGPSPTTRAERKSVPSREKSHEDWQLYQALIGITSDYVFLVKQDGTVECLGQSGFGPTAEGRNSEGEPATGEDGHAGSMSAVAGLVASSLMDRGKAQINRARQEKDVQDFSFDATITGRLCHFVARLTATEKGEVLAVVRDSTGERLLHSTLSETERYRQLLDRTVDGVLIIDVETGKVRICNESAASLLACNNATELAGQNFMDFVCEEDKECISSLIKDQTSDVNSGQTLEFRIVRKDGIEIWVRAGVSSADWSGALSRLVCMADVTELKRTEEALQQSEERFNGLVRTTLDWVWEINTEGAYTYASPKVTDILGYDPTEVLGKTPLDLMSKEEAERVVNDFVSLLSTREPFDGLEVVCLHKDGHAVSINKSGVPFFGKEGRLLGYRGVDRNVSNGVTATTSERKGDSSSAMIEGMIQVITSIMETRDRYTAMHQQYVARLAADIAAELGLTKDQIQSVRIAALLHDVGKMCIPAEILNKPSQLSRVESDILRGHPRAGYDILKNIEFPWPVGQMVLQHHERMNGSGYPAGLKGEEILQEARILAVADVVVAMSSHRPYRPAQSLEKALREVLENRGTLYDAAVVDACLTLASRKGFSFQEEKDSLMASPIEHGVTSGRAGLAFGIC